MNNILRTKGNNRRTQEKYYTKDVVKSERKIKSAKKGDTERKKRSNEYMKK